MRAIPLKQKIGNKETRNKRDFDKENKIMGKGKIERKRWKTGRKIEKLEKDWEKDRSIERKIKRI